MFDKLILHVSTKIRSIIFVTFIGAITDNNVKVFETFNIFLMSKATVPLCTILLNACMSWHVMRASEDRHQATNACTLELV